MLPLALGSPMGSEREEGRGAGLFAAERERFSQHQRDRDKSRL